MKKTIYFIAALLITITGISAERNIDLAQAEKVAQSFIKALKEDDLDMKLLARDNTILKKEESDILAGLYKNIKKHPQGNLKYGEPELYVKIPVSLENEFDVYITLVRNGEKWYIVSLEKGDISSKNFMEYENRYYTAQGIILGKYLAANFPRKKVLLIMENDYQRHPRTEILIDALKKGAGNDLDIVSDTVNVAASGSDSLSEMPLYEIMKAADFDKTLDKNKDCEVIVSAVGLPRDLRKSKLWSSKARPAVILFQPVDMRGYNSLMRDDIISTIVTVSPQAQFDEDPTPEDPQQAFDKRYIIVDKKNMEKYQNIFF